MADGVEVLVDVGKAALVPYIIAGFILVENEFVAVLVDGVVCEMHEEVFQVVMAGGLVGLGRKPGETFVVHVDAEGISAAEEDVDSQVEFKALY